MDTETHADWSCSECDTSHQIFLEHHGRWEVTEESQELLTHHRSGACRPVD